MQRSKSISPVRLQEEKKIKRRSSFQCNCRLPAITTSFMLPAKQIQMITTNTHLSGSLPSLLASNIRQVFAALKLFLHWIPELQWDTTRSVVTGCKNKALERVLGASIVEQGAQAVLCFLTPCHGFDLQPGSAGKPPDPPLSSAVILTAACHLFQAASRHFKEQNGWYDTFHNNKYE